MHRYIFVLLLLTMPGVSQRHPNSPRVYLQAQSHGNTWAARRDQSMEMAKDFQMDCPDVIVTVSQEAANYMVTLNHIEVGLLARDNQVQVSDRNGDMLRLHEGNGMKSGSIRGSVKIACKLILENWQASFPASQAAAPPATNPETRTLPPAAVSTAPAQLPVVTTATPVANATVPTASVVPAATSANIPAPAGPALPAAEPNTRAQALRKCPPPKTHGIVISGATPQADYCPKQ